MVIDDMSLIIRWKLAKTSYSQQLYQFFLFAADIAMFWCLPFLKRWRSNF